MNIQPVISQFDDLDRHIRNIETRLGRIAVGQVVAGIDLNDYDNPTSEQRNYRWKRFHILEQRIRRIKIHAAKMRIIGFEILANVGEPDDSEEEV